jgi:electron transfer flavoprotein alpha subunit
MGGVWVYLERQGNGISEAASLALGSTAALAERLGEPLVSVCVGGERAVFEGLSLPSAKLYHVSGESLSDYATDLFGAALEELLARHTPSLFVFPPTTQGEDLASWLAAGLGVGVLLGTREIRREGDRFVATRVEFDGKVAVDYEFVGAPVLVTLEERGADLRPVRASGADVAVEEVPFSGKGGRVRVVETKVAAKTVDLREARIIVGIGAGVGGGEGLEWARRLATAMGAELGGTRAAVDAGWVSHDRQIGQTGVKVKPELYLACGISGAVQHRVGIMESGTIVSINIDPQAPIFRFSHYCVEGDLKAVLPRLIQLLGR